MCVCNLIDLCFCLPIKLLLIVIIFLSCHSLMEMAYAHSYFVRCGGRVIVQVKIRGNLLKA